MAQNLLMSLKIAASLQEIQSTLLVTYSYAARSLRPGHKNGKGHKGYNRKKLMEKCESDRAPEIIIMVGSVTELSWGR